MIQVLNRRYLSKVSFYLDDQSKLDFLLAVKLRIKNEKGAKVEKLICGEGNRIYPDLVPNPIYSFRPLKGKFTKEGIFPVEFSRPPKLIIVIQ